MEEVAFEENCCKADQVLAWERFKEETTAPVVGEMVRVPSELLTEEMEPPPPPLTHTPLMEKQPAERSIPLEKVDEASVPVMFRYGVWIPPEKVEVPVPVK